MLGQKLDSFFHRLSLGNVRQKIQGRRSAAPFNGGSTYLDPGNLPALAKYPQLIARNDFLAFQAQPVILQKKIPVFRENIMTERPCLQLHCRIARDSRYGGIRVS